MMQCGWEWYDWLEFGTRGWTENQHPIGTVAVTYCISKGFSVIMRVSVCRVTESY
jgi:polyferredoxin